ncbi:MAG: hypothetical protein EOP53_15645 [Sphingobacteriales bacterium]|nr:MAG: hypothetical protein EOP53_15645 [Sphingobacteriales bacterium]
MTKTSQFIFVALGQTLMMLFLSTLAFSQSRYKIAYGDLDTNRISVEEFKNQKQLKSPDGISMDSAVAYFSIPGQTTIALVQYLPKFDSFRFRKYSDMLVPGATVIFSVFIKDKKHKSDSVQLNYMFYSMAKGNINFPSSPQYLEWKKLTELNYVSGRIYFSGTYFPNVISFSIKQGKTEELKKLFDRCAIGTVITFDNTSFKDDKGILVTRNDSFTF